ncbi:MAG: T9SS type A sorting domain-containing protein, partial [Ginsengibacter sp.]
PLGLASPGIEIATSPNPMSTSGSNILRYHVAAPSVVKIMLYDASGKPLKVLVNKKVEAGTYTTRWNANGMANGSYFISGNKDGGSKQTITVVKE